MKLKILKPTAILGPQLKPGDEIEVACPTTARAALLAGVAEEVEGAETKAKPLPGAK